MRTALAFAAVGGFLASSLFEDAIRNPCEGRVPVEWLYFFGFGLVVCAVAVWKLSRR